MSSDAKDFITALMQKEPSHRSSASQALNHPWMVSRINQLYIKLITSRINQLNIKLITHAYLIA